MSLGLFVATGSLFLGQQQVFPEALRGTAALTAAAPGLGGADFLDAQGPVRPNLQTRSGRRLGAPQQHTEDPF